MIWILHESRVELTTTSKLLALPNLYIIYHKTCPYQYIMLELRSYESPICKEVHVLHHPASDSRYRVFPTDRCTLHTLRQTTAVILTVLIVKLSADPWSSSSASKNKCYLRHRTYLNIAHQVWFKGQSRGAGGSYPPNLLQWRPWPYRVHQNGQENLYYSGQGPQEWHWK